MKNNQEIEDQNWEVINETDDDFDLRLKCNNMKRIKVFGDSELMIGHKDGEPVVLTNTMHSYSEDENSFTLYDSYEIYRLYKLLEHADSEGAFNNIKEEVFFEEIK